MERARPERSGHDWRADVAGQQGPRCHRPRRHDSTGSQTERPVRRSSVEQAAASHLHRGRRPAPARPLLRFI